MPLLALLCVQGRSHAQVVGGFDSSRGGAQWFFPQGNAFDTARSLIPGASFRAFGHLTSLPLCNVELLVLSSVRTNFDAIVPLSDAEQSMLAAFVAAGGSALLLPDNSTFDGANSDPANESLLDVFGIDIAGTQNGFVLASVLDPGAHLMTDGPFGTIPSFTQSYPGGLTELGPFAQQLAVNGIGGALLAIEADAIAPGSGRVAIFSSVETFGDEGNNNQGVHILDNEALWLNVVAWLLETSVPFECTCLADCNTDGNLSILDFVCFQTRFQAGDFGADANGDGILNILDFIAFQQVFQSGCP